MGILYGSAYIDEMWTEPLGENILVSRPINGFNAPKNISELTKRTLNARNLILALYETTDDKSIFSIDFDVDKEVTVLPQGSYRCCDLVCETRYEDHNPAISPHQTKQVSLTVQNKSCTDYELNISADADHYLCITGGGNCTLKPDETVVFHFEVTASNQKSSVYHDNFKLTQLCGKRNWTSYHVPFTLLPTNDWRIMVDDREFGIQHYTTARFDLENLLTNQSQEMTAKTSLYVPYAQKLDLLVICREPIRLYVDGALCVSSDEPTIIIPAYHRADRQKCAELFLEAGYHDIELHALKANELKHLFFYAVNKDFYSAGDIDCFLEAF